MIRISYNPPPFGPLLLGVLAYVVATLALSAAPALAATGNAYRSQFNGTETAAKLLLHHGGQARRTGHRRKHRCV
jgi:hypothetical protein